MDPIPLTELPLGVGIRWDVDPDDLPPGALRDAVNVEWSHPIGVVRPRRGSRTLCAESAATRGGHPADPLGNSSWNFSADVRRLVVDDAAGKLWALVTGHSGGGLKVYRADLAVTGPGFAALAGNAAYGGDLPPSAAAYKGLLYVATGATAANSNAVVGDNGVATLSAVAPRIFNTPTLTLIAGTLSAESGYIHGFLLKDSRTGGRGPLLQIGYNWTGAFTNYNIQLTIFGEGDAGVWDKIEIYRTTDGGGTLRYLAEIPNPGAGNSTTYVDSTTDDKLGYISPPRRVGRLPTCKFNLVHMDRMLWASRTEGPIDPNVVYYSEPYLPFTCDPVRNFLTVRPEDGDILTGLARLYNRVFAFKTRQIYELASNLPDSPYRVEPIVNEGAIGCVAPASIVEIEGRLFFLSFAGVGMFDGQAATIVPGPLSQVSAERQLYYVDYTNPPTTYEYVWTQNDVVTETFHFKVEFFANSTDVPGINTPVATFDTESADGYLGYPAFTLDGNTEPFPSTGLVLAPGEARRVHLHVVADDGHESLTLGQTYYVWITAKDSLQTFDPLARGGWTAAPYRGRTYGVNWARAGRFFAIDHWPTHEYWLFTASPGSDVIDTKWVLDYRTLEAETGPVWRRELVQASSCALVASLDVDASHPDAIVPVFGDANGCVWIGNWIDGYDHYVQRTSQITYSQRLRAATVGGSVNAWTLTASGGSPGWPTSGAKLRGERVVCRDSWGNVYTGVVADNSASVLTVGRWLDNYVPRIGTSVVLALGGLDARIEFQPSCYGDAAHAKEIRCVALRGQGTQTQVDVELMLGESPQVLADAYTAHKRMAGLMVGGEQYRRYPARGRAKAIGLRVSTYLPKRDWRLSALGLGLRNTGSRK